MPPPSRAEQQRLARAERVAAERAQQRRTERTRRLAIAGGAVAVVLVVLAGLVVIGLRGGGAKTSRQSAVASPAVTRAVTAVPAALLTSVGAGPSRPDGIVALDGHKLTSADGKPRVVYIGAEYCPFCAAERWPVTVALSRFGTWAGLGQTYSSASDTDPNTPTLSFHGATYTSGYLSFEGVETTTNQRAGSDYTPLDTPSTEQQQLLTTYDAPPYQQGTGSIPFVDLGGLYSISGAGYDPALLAGKTPDQVAALLTAGTSSQATAILGAANRLTAALCRLTGDQPAAVCTTAPVPALGAQLPKAG